jgi:uncharacterized protein YjiS (DUF1127 family)
MIAAISLGITTVRPRRLRWIEIRQSFAEWRHRTRWRHELTTLDDVSLRDICMSRGAAEFEASKPFWMS